MAQRRDRSEQLEQRQDSTPADEDAGQPGERAPDDGGAYIRLRPELAAERIAALAAELGFSDADVARRAAQLSDEERAWLRHDEQGAALLLRSFEARRGAAADTVFPPEEPDSLAAYQAALCQRAITASVVLEQAERAYHAALAALEREAVLQRDDALRREQAPLELARRLIERDLAARFPDVLDPGDPFQLPVSAFYASDAYVAFDHLKLAAHNRAVERRQEAHGGSDRVAKTLRRLARTRQAERAAWTVQLEAWRGQA